MRALEYTLRRAFSAILYDRLYRRVYPLHPFFTPGAIKELGRLLLPRSRVFEWGSGLSTIWIGKRVGTLISVEHDEAWYERSLAELHRQDLKAVKLLLRPTNESGDGYDWGAEWPHYPRLQRAPRKRQFIDYMFAIDDYPDSYFDCIVLDGRERVGCAMHAIQKLSPAGTLILDDSYRPQYGEIFTLLSDWSVQRFTFGILQTTFFSR